MRLWVVEFDEGDGFLPRTVASLTEDDAEDDSAYFRENLTDDFTTWPDGTVFRVVAYIPVPSPERVEEIVREAVRVTTLVYADEYGGKEDEIVCYALRHAIRLLVGEPLDTPTGEEE